MSEIEDILKLETFAFVHDIICCYPSSNCSVFALFQEHKEINFFQIFDSQRPGQLFNSLEVREITNKLNENLEIDFPHLFDFSPSHAEFVLFLEGKIWLYNFITKNEQIIELIDYKESNPVLIVKFLNQETLVVLQRYRVLILIDIKSKAMKKFVVDKQFKPMNCFAYYIDRKNKTIMSILKHSWDRVSNKLYQKYSIEMKIPTTDAADGKNTVDTTGTADTAKVTCEIKELEKVQTEYLSHMTNHFMISCSEGTLDSDNFIIDMSDFCDKGEYQVHNALFKNVEIGGIEFFSILIDTYGKVFLQAHRFGNYLLAFDHKIFLEDHGKLEYIDMRQFTQTKLDAIVCCGLAGYSEHWVKFLMRGLYDPRLLCFIFAFAGMF